MNDQRIKDMCKAHFNEPVIVGFDLVRLIGYAEDDEDCYLICSSTTREVFWVSAVGGYTFLDRLKGQGYVKSTEGEDWDDLYRLNSVLELNGTPKVDEFIVDIRLGKGNTSAL